MKLTFVMTTFFAHTELLESLEVNFDQVSLVDVFSDSRREAPDSECVDEDLLFLMLEFDLGLMHGQRL
jgi:hypothetical protein